MIRFVVNRFAVAAVMAGCLLPAATAAAAGVGAFSISPMYGYRDGGRFEVPEQDRTRNLDGASSVAVVLGYEFEPRRYYEVLYAEQRTTVGASNIDVNVTYLQLGGRVDYPGEHFVRYLSGTVGASRIKARNGGSASSLRPGASIGGGVQWPLASRLAVRVEVRGYLTLTGGDTNILCVSESGEAFCELAYRGDMLFQAEVLGGLTLRF